MTDDRETLAELTRGGLRELLQMIAASDVEELELEVGGTRIRVKRPLGAVSSSISSDGHVELAASAPEATLLTAERVGFFHYPVEPTGAPPKVGDQVDAGQTLGMIDSLSVLIPVQAACSGRVEEVLVEEGQPVEFGQPLFLLQLSEGMEAG